MSELSEYQRKRKAAETPEPPAQPGRSSGSRFVVQRHQASHLHYDFRLEMEGVLKSWAVPKGPPSEPGERRLAVQVEDHPVDYITFSGTIPEGQYGAGTVEIWDQGDFNLAKKTEKEIEFVLKGQKLHGGFVLVHTNGRNWLFLKRKSS